MSDPESSLCKISARAPHSCLGGIEEDTVGRKEVRLLGMLGEEFGMEEGRRERGWLLDGASEWTIKQIAARDRRDAVAE